MTGGSFKGQFMQTRPKIRSSEKLAENPLANVDLMSLYSVRLPLICKCLWQMVHPNMLLFLRACRSCAMSCSCHWWSWHTRTRGRLHGYMPQDRGGQMWPVWSKCTTEENVELMFRSVCEEAKHLLNTQSSKTLRSSAALRPVDLQRRGRHATLRGKTWRKKRLQNKWEVKSFNETVINEDIILPWDWS